MEINKFGLIVGVLAVLWGNSALLAGRAEGEIPHIYAQAGNHSARLSWSSPPGGELLGYKIYRKLWGESTFEQIDSTITDTFYVDHGLINDTLYSYFVTRVDLDTIESDSSRIVDLLPNNWIVFVEAMDIYRMDAKDANADGVGDNKLRLTFSGANDITPDLSPDGTRIVFSSNRDGNYELYSMNSLDGGNLSRLTFNTYTDVSPTWSSDGSKIAYSADRFCNYDIFLMDAPGGEPSHQLTTNPGYDGNPAFSPDGDQLAFDSQEDSTYRVYQVDAEGSGESECISDSLEGDAGSPRYSPDGERLVLCSRAQEAEWKELSDSLAGYRIFLMDIDGLHGFNLTIDPPFFNQYNVYPHLLPQDFITDTISVYFSSDWDGDNEIYLLRGPNEPWLPQILRLTNDNIENSPTGGIRAIQPEIIPPACPDSISLSVDAKSLTVGLSWNPNQEGDLAYYSIYRDEQCGFHPDSTKRLDTLVTTTFLDTTVEADHTYYYIVTATDTLGSESGYSGQEEAEVGVGMGGGSPILPQRTALSQNYPNPFNPTTVISYQLAADNGPRTLVTLKIYNVLGEEVRALVRRRQGPGYYSVRWDGNDDLGREVASGLYLCRLTAGGFTQMRKMVFLK